MRLLPGRALAAIGLTIASVGAMFGIGVQAAHASPVYWFSASYSTSWGAVYVTVDKDATNNTVYEEVDVENHLNDSNRCVEGWVDLFLNSHRPANPFTACREPFGGGYYSGVLQLHWPRSGSNPGSAVLSSQVTDTTHIKLALCPVDVRVGHSPFARSDSFCSESGQTVGAIHNQSYNGLSWQGMQNIPYPCSPSCSVDMRPEYTNRGYIDIANGANWDGGSTGDFLVSFDGSHRLVLQGDGNLVLYNDISNTATWAVTNCLKPGYHISTGDYIVIQGSDGNFVLYDSGGAAIWASANSNLNACSLGSYTSGGNPYLIMQADGNMVEYFNGSAIWSTGTSGH